MTVLIHPARLHGEVPALPSKSHIHRLMIAMFLAGEEPRDFGGASKDIEATKNCLKALAEEDEPQLDCGESGSTARFLLPVAAALKDSATLTGHGRLTARPFKELCDAMRACGAETSSEHLPITVSGRLMAGEYSLPGNVSSQYISGLLFALPLLEGRSSVNLTSPLESAGYVDMTLSVLRSFGIEIIEMGDRYIVPGGQVYHCPEGLSAEGDWSNAAFWLAAGVKVTGLRSDSSQRDKAILKILEEARYPFEMKLDVRDIPDLAPIIAVIGAMRQGRTTVSGGARLRLKESDRIKTVCRLITDLGGKISETDDGFIVEGSGILQGGTVNGSGDHRIVMAAAIASTVCRTEVRIEGAEAVEKSYPGFFDDFRKLGGDIHVI